MGGEKKMKKKKEMGRELRLRHGITRNFIRIVHERGEREKRIT